MNHVFVAQEKNTNTVVGLYRKKYKEIKKIKNSPIPTNKFFLDLKILSILELLEFNELKLSKLSMNPLLLPILKNLFFLSLKISSGDIILK